MPTLARPADVQAYLHEHIPLTAAIGVTAEVVEPGRVVLAAPLPPNLNHQRTMFGGSISSLGITVAWTLLHVRLRAHGFRGELVVQHSETHFGKPITDTAEAICEFDDEESWNRFTAVLDRAGKSRIAVRSEIRCGGKLAAVTEGTYVALAR